MIPPGKQPFQRHARMAEEEIFGALRVRGTLPQGRERVAVEAGNVAAFPAATGVAHAFVADLGEEPEFLSIGERNDNDVVLHPDSGKLLVAGVADENGEREDRLGRLQETDYFDGELSGGPRGRLPPVEQERTGRSSTGSRPPSFLPLCGRRGEGAFSEPRPEGLMGSSAKVVPRMVATDCALGAPRSPLYSVCRAQRLPAWLYV